MHSTSSSTDLVIGLAAFGLAMVIGCVWLHRRKQREGAAGGPDKEMEVEAGTDDETHSLGEDLPDSHEAHQNKHPKASPEILPLIYYFSLVFVLSIPFWLIGGNRLPVPMNLPVSAIAFVCPVIAASILSYRRHGLNGIRELFKKAFDTRKIKNKIWYVPILLLMPSIYILSYAIMRLVGLPLPDPINFPFFMAPVFFVVFFISATCEELGWSGYAIDPMQNRWGAFKASIILGLVWGIWHVIGHLQAGQTVSWIVFHRLYSIALRILIVWIYNNTGKSVFAAILVHTVDNVSVFLFPNYGSYYNPVVTGMITWLTTGIVTFLWGPRTLARYRFT